MRTVEGSARPQGGGRIPFRLRNSQRLAVRSTDNGIELEHHQRVVGIQLARWGPPMLRTAAGILMVARNLEQWWTAYCRLRTKRGYAPPQPSMDAARTWEVLG